MVSMRYGGERVLQSLSGEIGAVARQDAGSSG